MGEFVDSSEVDALVADLTAAPFTSGENIVKAVEVTSRNVRDAWRDKLKGSQTVPRGAHSVTYELGANESFVRKALTGNDGASEVYAEIGPELGRAQGPIVGMLEFGTPTTGPRGFGLESLRENEADFQKGLEMAVDAAMKERGL